MTTWCRKCAVFDGTWCDESGDCWHHCPCPSCTDWRERQARPRDAHPTTARLATKPQQAGLQLDKRTTPATEKAHG